ncbi:MAG: PA2779 family protein [Chromatiales bacterium]|jgi:hypothetical protein|nr:PA2779 family protein [Chromatiales bacterium]MDX9766665.1 PA2779 family protein [Ectothiorhodospiraceae bacterium]
MSAHHTVKRIGTFALIGVFLGLQFGAVHASTVQASSLVGTGTLLEAQSSFDRERLLGALDREDVQRQLVALGVDPADARLRVERLTADELVALNERMAELPAGGNALGIIALVFIVLIITDALGYTDVFSFVRPPK